MLNVSSASHGLRFGRHDHDKLKEVQKTGPKAKTPPVETDAMKRVPVVAKRLDPARQVNYFC